MAVRPDLSRSSDSGELGSLADIESCHDALVLGSEDRSWLLDALKSMVSIRAAEEKIGAMVAEGRIRCPCHLAIGQEAAAVGVATQLHNTDRVFGAHRSHAHYLALGGSLHGLMAEVQGKETGVSRGMGGSMHLIDIEHGLYGTVPIVGATIPIAVGAGLAAKMDGKGAVAVSFFGDGATEEGVFHEAMNLAANLRVPVLFVCENNFFSSHLHIRLRQPKWSVCRYAEAHCVPWDRVDGNDVGEIARVTSEAVTAMRAGGGPRFLELVTYRWRGHVGPREDEDVGVERKDDLVQWKRRDPVRRLAEALVTAGLLDPAGLGRLTLEAKVAVEEAWGRATRDPFPPTEALLDRVYTNRPNP